MPKEPTKPPVPMQITAELTTLVPRFANSVQLLMLPDQFIFDFLYAVDPAGGGSGMHLGRFALTPSHAKRLRDVLQRQLLLYERKHGRIRALPSLTSPVKAATARKKVRRAR